MSKKVKAKYANGLSVSISPAEVRMLFTLNTPILEDGKDTGKVTTEDVSDIRINHALAVKIYEILDEYLMKVENAGAKK